MLSFDVVRRQVITVYSKLSKQYNITWSLKEVETFFEIFYEYHKKCCKYEHPYLKNKTIDWIICNIGFDDNGMEYSLEDYRNMIPQYFKTSFDNCDYSIVHFMSGDIRLMRYYEVLY